jgi:hypothetical protein
MFWKKRPITHAAGLWLLVLAAAAALAVVIAYASSAPFSKGVRPSGEESVYVPPVQPPTLFGTVVSFDGTVLKVESKQPYEEVVIEAGTKITTVGGSEVSSSALVPGAIVTATGRTVGEGRLAAVAVVILETE